jgi:hypothetical protein
MEYLAKEKSETDDCERRGNPVETCETYFSDTGAVIIDYPENKGIVGFQVWGII